MLERADDVDIATFRNGAMDLADDGFSVTPDFQGVAVENVATPHKRDGNTWGTFPQKFVDFVEKTSWELTGTALATLLTRRSHRRLSRCPARSPL
ncbi:hypothetical protein [Auritidibacter ignavus]|uniref:hypothetical protein n=1 Tax=Auritidibacter ignavus TaxID=678932 RepID=UPI00141A78D1|nr:hypothetical protein [Auritidibacter ignavus]NIH71847.1 hypothetical protein [Auritidibacter ignavus]WGH85186.1 hypothetical protein QDX24_06185 [Auritidibacter ignavus]WGH87474.1 hypothetical protein QDX22_06180 [Auritidibacter ignavus]WHS34285.1 hypothetical protein QM403_08000 [Auritidibacter ignavus]